MGGSIGPGFGYWLIIGALLVLGFLSGFSIGGIFWYIAIVMILLSPFRSRPRLLKTAIALFAGFLIGYVLVVPFGCYQSSTFDESGVSVSDVVCRSLTGLEYSGPEPYEPSPVPAVMAGSALAVVASAATWWGMGRHPERRSDDS